MKRFIRHIIHHFPKKRALVSLTLAVLLIIADYLLSNLTFPIFNSSTDFQYTGFIFSNLGQDSDKEFDNIFCINMALEKELVELKDGFGDTMGNVAVTSRAMLDSVVNLAREAGAANIIVDVRFSEGMKSPGDSALFSDMIRTDGLLISNHREGDYGETPSVLIPKTAMNDYRGLKGAGFSRYELLQDNRPSTAARLWQLQSGHEIRKRGFLYFDSGRLCYNCPFIVFPALAATGTNLNLEELYPYLRTQILMAYSEEELKSMMKGKIVIIGDFDNDRHDTYVGSVPGPILSYFAFVTLERGDHLVKFFPQFLLLLIYWAILFILLSPSLLTFGKKKGTWRDMLMILIECIGWGGLLLVVKWLYFNIWHIALLTDLPALLIFVLLIAKKVSATVKNNRTENEQPKIA